LPRPWKLVASHAHFPASSFELQATLPCHTTFSGYSNGRQSLAANYLLSVARNHLALPTPTKIRTRAKRRANVCCWSEVGLMQKKGCLIFDHRLGEMYVSFCWAAEHHWMLAHVSSPMITCIVLEAFINLLKFLQIWGAHEAETHVEEMKIVRCGTQRKMNMRVGLALIQYQGGGLKKNKWKTRILPRVPIKTCHKLKRERDLHIVEKGTLHYLSGIHPMRRPTNIFLIIDTGVSLLYAMNALLGETIGENIIDAASGISCLLR
jgi:hypothetical protein